MSIAERFSILVDITGLDAYMYTVNAMGPFEQDVMAMPVELNEVEVLIVLDWVPVERLSDVAIAAYLGGFT